MTVVSNGSCFSPPHVETPILDFSSLLPGQPMEGLRRFLAPPPCHITSPACYYFTRTAGLRFLLKSDLRSLLHCDSICLTYYIYIALKTHQPLFILTEPFLLLQ
ncbi:hypothetical protein K449DRAFT_227058 [Hypoxylon sp. EC38]|nr:hypothetical protein K449DRAFT_227058 [Hypoxylon sp. EC38]